MTPLLYALAFAPLMLPQQTTFHESSHLLIPAWHGLKLHMDVLPVLDGKSGETHYGQAEWDDCCGGAPMTHVDTDLSLMAPRMTDWLLVLGLGLWRQSVDAKESPWLWGWLAASQIAAVVDFCANTLQILSPYKFSDARRLYDRVDGKNIVGWKIASVVASATLVGLTVWSFQ